MLQAAFNIFFDIFGFLSHFLQRLTLFTPGDLPPPSRICVYAGVYAHTRANFFGLFVILSVEEGTTLLTPKKITVFYKSQSNLPNFHKGGPLQTSQSP